MALRVKRERAHQFYRLLPETTAPTPYQPFIDPVAASQFKAKVTYKAKGKPKPRRAYVPMTTLELLEWQFMCWRPSLERGHPDYRVLTRKPVAEGGL